VWMSIAATRSKSIPYSYFSPGMAAVYCDLGALTLAQRPYARPNRYAGA
jgi:hypothetical protein